MSRAAKLFVTDNGQAAPGCFELGGVLKSGGAQPLDASASRLRLRADAAGLVEDIPFGWKPAFRSSPAVVEIRGAIYRLAAGRWSAEWTMDGERLDAIAFDVQGDGTLAPAPEPLHLTCFGAELRASRVGISHEPDLLVEFSNRTGAWIDMADAWMAARLAVDGKMFPNRSGLWDGASEVGPGQLWVKSLSTDVFVPSFTSGAHLLRLELAGATSSPLHIEW